MDIDWVESLMVVDDDEAFLHLFNLMDRYAIRKTHEEIMSTIDMLGGSVRSYRCERNTQARGIVSEIYPGPRVTALARRRRRRRNYGVAAGVALDLTTTDDQEKPWDFKDPRQRLRASCPLVEQRPTLLIDRGAPLSLDVSRLASTAPRVRIVGATQ